jgi:hypothetical protein
LNPATGRDSDITLPEPIASVTEGLPVGPGEASGEAVVGVGAGVGGRPSPVPMLTVQAGNNSVSIISRRLPVLDLIH